MRCMELHIYCNFGLLLREALSCGARDLAARSAGRRLLRAPVAALLICTHA